MAPGAFEGHSSRRGTDDQRDLALESEELRAVGSLNRRADAATELDGLKKYDGAAGRRPRWSARDA